MQINTKDAEIGKPGSFTTVLRTFSDGDRITLHFPMTTRIVQWENDTASIERGPLVYSLKIEEDATPQHGVKTSADFPAWDKRPASAWNYALSSTTLNDVKTTVKPVAGCPWDTGNSPISLQLPARRIENWQLPESGGNPGFVASPTLSDQIESITLVPYGSTCLRLTVFPVAPPRP
jgi:hypothetical protein